MPPASSIGVPDDDTATAWCAYVAGKQLNELVAQALNFARRLVRAAFEFEAAGALSQARIRRLQSTDYTLGRIGGCQSEDRSTGLRSSTPSATNRSWSTSTGILGLTQAALVLK
jgi:outer membrane protein TolC